jgi:DNA-directed RNA polymerase specialized sigma24 family protein
MIDFHRAFWIESGLLREGMLGPSLSSAECRAFSKAAECARSVFPTTRWSQVCAAGESVAEGDAAFADLCNDYWPPIFAYLRRRGLSEADAQDLAQGFFLHLIEHRTLRRADPHRGRFRSFLLGALKNYLANEIARASRDKRGGNRKFFSLNDPSQPIPEPSVEADAIRLYEESWASELMSHSLARLRERFRGENRADLFAVLERFLGEPVISEDAARALGSSIGALRTAVSRLRKQFGEQIRLEIARTVSAPHLIEEEFQYLRSVLERM